MCDKGKADTCACTLCGHGSDAQNASIEIVDMHCHLGFSPNFDEVLHELSASNLAVFCNTVVPAEFKKLHRCLSQYSNDLYNRVALGLGMHPWWVANSFEQDAALPKAYLECFEEQLHNTNMVGEIGLDFSPKWESSKEIQMHVFEEMLKMCAQNKNLTISFHAVKSASTVLDMIEKYSLQNSCNCIMHWFSGSSDELQQAISMGCWFSVCERMAKSKRGKEYIKAIPPNKILLETDAPSSEGETIGLDEICMSLHTTSSAIGDLRSGWSQKSSTEQSLKLLNLAIPQ